MAQYEYELLKVHDADAIIIRHYVENKPYIILIDAGNEKDAYKIKKHLQKYYDKLYIDLAICTHPDSDHKDGFFGLLNDKEVTIKELWLTDPADHLDSNDIQRYRSKPNAVAAVRKIWQKSTDASLNLIDLAMANSVKVRSVIDGAGHEILPITIVGPTPKYYKEVVKDMVADYGVKTYESCGKDYYDNLFAIDEDEIRSVIDEAEDDSPYNASSLVVLYEPEVGKKLLFAGDATTTSLQMMLENYRKLRNVDLLKVPHHGSERNLNTSIIKELSPKKSYISADGNKNHPSARLVYWLSKYGDVYSTHTCKNFIHHQTGNLQRANVTSIKPLKRKQSRNI
jgi:beta-lactamase superfamily II metal-dependent hydrolase